MKKIALLTLAMGLVVGAFAKSDPYDVCTNKYPHMNNAVVAECSEYASDIYKKSMTKSYKKIYASLKASSPDDAKLFEKSQQSWIAYRDAHCQIMGTYVGSPMYGYCPMQLNEQRAEELEELAESF